MHVRALKLYILQILNIQTYWRIAKRCENYFCLPPDQSEIDCIDCTVLGDECQCFTEEYLNWGYFRVQSCQFREISQQQILIKDLMGILLAICDKYKGITASDFTAFFPGYHGDVGKKRGSFTSHPK